MESGTYGLTRGTCLVALRFEVVAVAGLLCISGCVWDAAEGFSFPPLFFFELTRPAASMRPPTCLSYLSNKQYGWH